MASLPSNPGLPRPWPINKQLIVDETPGRTPSLAFRALETALESNDLRTLREIIQLAPETLREVNPYGCTPLMLATSLQAIEMLLPHQDPLATDDDGSCALGALSEHNHPRVLPAIAALLPHANPNHADRFGRTPLMRALTQGRDDVALLLLPVSDLASRDAEGRDALALAALNQRVTLLAPLLEQGANPLAQDIHGCSALMLACRSLRFAITDNTFHSKRHGILSLLTPETAAQTDAHGWGALHHALESLSYRRDFLLDPDRQKAALPVFRLLDTLLEATPPDLCSSAISVARESLGFDHPFIARLDRRAIGSALSDQPLAPKAPAPRL